MKVEPRGLSVIVPARNAADTLAQCLGSICSQATDADEVIVVDDYSDDASAQIAARFPARVIRMMARHGAAAARNRGAKEAAKSTLFFVDADVVLASDGIARARRHASSPSFAAVIGSYDDVPAAHSSVSMFKNLAHHFFHQRSTPEISSFWGACGLIRRDLFMAAGGFDEQRFVAPSIEDVELGYRLSDASVRIRIDPELRVTHCKRWTLGSLILTDLVRRAIPWSILCLERGRLPTELNHTAEQRVAALIALALLVFALLLPFQYLAAPVLLALIGAAMWINWDLYRLFFDKGGIRLMLTGFALQQLYYVNALSGLLVGFGIFAVRHLAAMVPAAWRQWR